MAHFLDQLNSVEQEGIVFKVFSKRIVSVLHANTDIIVENENGSFFLTSSFVPDS